MVPINLAAGGDRFCHTPEHQWTRQVIKGGMKYRYRVIFRHIDLIQNPEAAIFRALINTAFAELYLIVRKRIGSDQVAAVGIYVK